MSTISLTYDQAAAIGVLVRDERPERVDISNPTGMGRVTVFASFWAESGDLTQHTVHTDGTVDTPLTIAA